MTEIDNNVETKIKLIYHCDMCEYKTIRKGNYAIHCNSKKHKNNECEATKNNILSYFQKLSKNIIAKIVINILMIGLDYGDIIKIVLIMNLLLMV